MNLKWREKSLDDLTYEEAVEFEKEVNKRLLAADRAGMSESIIEQLQTYVDHIKLHQKEAMAKMNMGLDGKAEDDTDDESYSLIIGEPEPTKDEDE